MAKYYTVGSESCPFYNKENDPQHCFATKEEAQDELVFFQEHLPEEGATRVWRASTAIRWDPEEKA